MNLMIQRFIKTVNNKKIIIVICIFAFIQLVLSISLIITTLAYDRIYKGVYINDIYVSGMTRSEAKRLLENTYIPKFQALKIVIKANETTEKVIPSEIVRSLDIERAVEQAYNVGRKGNIVHRLFEIVNSSIHPQTFYLRYEYDEAKLQQLIGKFALRVKKDVIQHSYWIYEEKLVIKKGVKGETIDEAELRQRLINRINNFESGELEIPVLIIEPDPLDIYDLHKKIYRMVKDATYTVTNYKLNIIPAVIGRDFDVEEARSKFNAAGEGDIIEIPLQITYPKIYENQLLNSLMKDCLASYSTRYSLADKNRSENIRLATSKINGIVLGPGDEFSFNKIVGARTANEGYKKAHVYVKGRIVEGIAGGICQVSTTLYNAVLLADLQVTSRTNHMMIVPYVQPGRDATVSYGSIDFRFRNNYKSPIKLLASVSGGILTVKVMGIKENPLKIVEIETEIVQTYYPKAKVISDPNKPVGYYKVVQGGMKGYKVRTFKVIKENNKIISKTLISTDVYNPLERIVVKGTKPDEDSAKQLPLEGGEKQDVLLDGADQ